MRCLAFSTNVQLCWAVTVSVSVPAFQSKARTRNGTQWLTAVRKPNSEHGNRNPTHPILEHTTGLSKGCVPSGTLKVLNPHMESKFAVSVNTGRIVYRAELRQTCPADALVQVVASKSRDRAIEGLIPELHCPLVFSLQSPETGSFTCSAFFDQIARPLPVKVLLTLEKHCTGICSKPRCSHAAHLHKTGNAFTQVTKRFTFSRLKGG